METAKVDIRKLQLLNDRINQCIDALNQVRLSVHGLASATTGVPGGIGANQNPAFGLEYGPGLSHTGYGQTPFAQPGTGSNPATPFGSPSPYSGQVPPQGYFTGFAPAGLPQQTGASGFGMNPQIAGLAHSSPETLEAFRRPMWADPFWAARIVQTFPYAQLPVPPVVTIY